MLTHRCFFADVVITSKMTLKEINRVRKYWLKSSVAAEAVFLRVQEAKRTNQAAFTAEPDAFARTSLIEMRELFLEKMDLLKLTINTLKCKPNTQMDNDLAWLEEEKAVMKGAVEAMGTKSKPSTTAGVAPQRDEVGVSVSTILRICLTQWDYIQRLKIDKTCMEYWIVVRDLFACMKTAASLWFRENTCS